MMIIKNIIKATIATTAVISSAFAMVLPGNALSPVTYKAASNYKLVPMGPTSCVVMSYTINRSQQTATAKYEFNGGTEVPNGEKSVSVVCELIIPTKNGETVIKNKSNGNGEYSRLDKMTKKLALTAAEKSEGYKNENRKSDFERCGGAGSDGGRDRSAVPRALLLVWRSVLRDGNGLDESAAV
ncbi:hypothetical protein [Hominenteromicrobium sp.]|uniref:hypothetical protein n=1 Tax=Hominenteromicrobium sp. TaxID=3073581 RepID=UPI003A905911